MTNLTLRNVKGTALTYNEGDANFANLDSDSPWVVAAGRIYYPGNVGIGPNSSNPTYHLDFGEGDSATNEATIGTSDADLHVHVDGARKFKVTTNSQERLTLTTTGKFGIGQPNPQFELDVDGYANISNTLEANNVSVNSFTDGTMSISGGSITNAKRIVSTTQIDFTQLYDRSTGYRVSSIDSELTLQTDAFPTSFAVKSVTDRLGTEIDSDHAWAVSKFDSAHAYVLSNNNTLQINIDSVYNVAVLLQEAQDSAAAATGLQEITDVGNVTTTTVRLSGGVETTTLTGSHLGFVGLEFGAAVLPLDNNGDQTSGATDLGSSSVKFKDGYFSGTVDAASVQSNASGWTAQLMEGNRLDFSRDGINYISSSEPSSSLKIQVRGSDAATIGDLFTFSKSIQPNANNTLDIGSTGLRFKDAYFLGKVNAGISQLGDQSASGMSGAGLYNTNTGTGVILTNDGAHFSPSDDDVRSLGSASYRFKDLYLSGTVNGSLTGNASSATQLQTARNINGTAFDGTANITTAQWGTARNISIGGTQKSVNGSTNYTWTKAEIQANNADTLTTARSINGVNFNGSANIANTFSNGVQRSGATISLSGSYTGTWAVTGAITATGDVTAFSDIAFKEEINPIVGALEKVSEIGGYTFKRKDDDSRKYTGVIAQEIQKVLPEAVHSNEQGLSVAYGNLTGLLIEAVKELNEKVKDLESKLGV